VLECQRGDLLARSPQPSRMAGFTVAQPSIDCRVCLPTPSRSFSVLLMGLIVRN